MEEVGKNHRCYTEKEKQWSRIRDAVAGSDDVKKAGEMYLPMPEGMSLPQYKSYVKRSVFYPVADRTLRGLTGLVFRHEPVFDLPARLEPIRDNATSKCETLNTLSKTIVSELLSMGRFGLLADFPEFVTSSEETPYVSTYNAENIVNWTIYNVWGKAVISRVELIDDVGQEEDDQECRLELLLDDSRYIVRRWMRNKKGNWDLMSETVPLIKGQPLNYIPFVFANAYDLLPNPNKPPILDLVDLNLAHYRGSADYEHALFLTAQPTPWINGGLTEDRKPTSIGPGTIWMLPQNASAGMLEFSGKGIEAQRNAMNDKEVQMASLGARMINDSRVRNESTDTARIRGRSELALLTSVVKMAELALYRTLRTCAEWVGSPDSLEVKFNRDWVETRMEAREIKELVASWQSGAMSFATLYENLQRGEIASVERTMEEEKELIEEDLGMAMAVDVEMEELKAKNKPEPVVKPNNETEATNGGNE